MSTIKQDLIKSLSAFGETLKGIVAKHGATKHQTMTAALADGTEIIIEGEALAPGVAVSTADGGQLADGSYTLSDGTQITVAEGVISDVASPENAEADGAPVAGGSWQEAFTALDARLAALEAAVASLAGIAPAEMKKAHAKTASDIKELAVALQKQHELLTKVAHSAAAAPVKEDRAKVPMGKYDQMAAAIK